MSTVLLLVVAILAMNVFFVGLLAWRTRDVPVRARIGHRTRGVGPRW